MRNAVIASSSMYAPEQVIPNQYFNELLKEDVDTWLVENLTIRERRWAKADQSTADLVTEEAQTALRAASISPEQLDLIIVATDTPEYISPSTASVVQHRLQAKNAGTFDLNTACAGFVTALDVAAKYIRADERYQHVVVVGAYAMSKYLNLHDKKRYALCRRRGCRRAFRRRTVISRISRKRTIDRRAVSRLDGHLRRRNASTYHAGSD